MKVLVVAALLLTAGCARDDPEPTVSDREHDICVNYANTTYPDQNLITTWEALYADCVERNGFTRN